MAKYTVDHVCGHEIKYNLFGKCVDRERKLEWLRTIKCRKCQIKEMIDSGEYETEEVHYSVYKDENLTAVPDSYDPETKTIKVLVERNCEKEFEVIKKLEQELISKENNGEVILSLDEAKKIDQDLIENHKKYNLNIKILKNFFNKMMQNRYEKTIDKENNIVKLKIKFAIMYDFRNYDFTK